MRHDDQVVAELQAQYDSLTAHIAAVDRDLATELDAERRMVLSDKRAALDGERRNVVDRMQTLSVSRDVITDAKLLPAASTAKAGRTLDYDELMRMIYEIRTDVAIMKRQFEDHIARSTENAELSPHALTFLAVGGVVTLLMLAFIVIRIGMSG